MKMNCKQIEKWGMLQVTLNGPDTGNPFKEVEIIGIFKNGEITKNIPGFYNGNGEYIIRFMPEKMGMWVYTTKSNVEILNSKFGKFECIKEGALNRGVVRVCDTYHFAYSNGEMFYPMGTTSYGWAHQNEVDANSTLKELSKSDFNKIRMMILPHYSEYSQKNIICYPFEGEPMDNWDFSRPNVEYFKIMDERILKLQEIGVEADIIVFNPYSKDWGFGGMGREVDIFYIKYLVARISAFRHVWWSAANEYDFVNEKNLEDWHVICQTIRNTDPYNHLLSIHNGYELYPNWKEWITHACVQDGLSGKMESRAVVLRNQLKKPVIYDGNML